MADKYQRRINRWIRGFNKALANDALGGIRRFSAKQVDCAGREFEKQYLIALRDSKTLQEQEVVVNNYNYRRTLFFEMNDFIINVRIKEGW